MDLYIYDLDFNGLGIVDTFDSLIWHRQYYESGFFEIYAPATQNNLNLLRVDRVVMKQNTCESGIIKSVVLSHDAEQESYITATGKFMSDVLSQRIIQRSFLFNDDIQELMHTLVRENCIETDTERVIPYLTEKEPEILTQTAEILVPQMNLHDFLSDLSKQYDICFRVLSDTENRQYIFETYRGKDSPQIIFSKEYDNLVSTQSTEDVYDKVNVVTAVYKSDTENISVTTGNAQGFERYEKIVTGEYIDDRESTMQGLISLAESTVYNGLYSFDGLVSADGYREDFDLGDIVTLRDEFTKTDYNKRITEVQEVVDNTGENIYFTFS